MTDSPDLRDLAAQALRKRRESAQANKAFREAKKAERPVRVDVRRVQPTAKGQRQPRVRDPAFLQWLRRLPCVACVKREVEPWFANSPVEAAHVRYSDHRVGRLNPGMQRKPSDEWAVSLCRHHHQHDQHAGAERAFWERLGIDPGELCPALYAAFKANADGAEVIRRYATIAAERGR